MDISHGGMFVAHGKTEGNGSEAVVRTIVEAHVGHAAQVASDVRTIDPTGIPLMALVPEILDMVKIAPSSLVGVLAHEASCVAVSLYLIDPITNSNVTMLAEPTESQVRVQETTAHDGPPIVPIFSSPSEGYWIVMGISHAG
jgi:hypothetical protein